MTKLQAYFYTDWQAMTTTDWIGMIMTVVIFIALVIVFYWTFNPKNKQKLESHRHLPFNHEPDKAEQDHG